MYIRNEFIITILSSCCYQCMLHIAPTALCTWRNRNSIRSTKWILNREAEQRTAECARWNICCVVDKVFHQMCWLLNGSNAIDSSRSRNLLRNVLTLLLRLLLLVLSLFSQLSRTIFIFMVNFIHFLMALNDLCYRPIAYRLFCWVIKSLRRSSTTVETVERNHRSWAFSSGILCFS